LEFTLTIPGALELIQDFSRDSSLIVSAGTVLKTEDARKAVAAGAHYLVSPITDAELIAEAAALKVPMMAGGHTPTELYKAYLLGAPLQKLFPAPAGGSAYVRSCLAPMPFLRIVPTNGIDLENAVPYLEAGSFAVGFVNSLFPADAVKEGRWDEIEQLAIQLRSKVSAGK
jgi:Entner-Doudoroff aldolase